MNAQIEHETAAPSLSRAGAGARTRAPAAAPPPPAAAAPPASLSVSGVSKAFAGVPVLRDVSLDVHEGELLAILGPSGCGKTTLLRVIGGLERQDAGRVHIGGVDVSAAPPSARGCGIVFQSYALFPNLTAAQNVAFALQRARLRRRERAERVDELLTMVGLRDASHKYPGELSGGQQQRVALIRALASSPTLLLLDEPLSAVDAGVRQRLRAEIRRLQRALGLATVLVTHDHDEAFTMADRIAVMEAGRIVQVSAPRELYQRPRTPFVADALGTTNVLRGWTAAADGAFTRGALRLRASDEWVDLPAGRRARLAFRPEDAVLMRPCLDARAENQLPAWLDHVEFRGGTSRAYLRLPLGGDVNDGGPGGPGQAGHDCQVLVDLPSRDAGWFEHLASAPLVLYVPPERLRVFPSGEGRP